MALQEAAAAAVQVLGLVALAIRQQHHLKVETAHHQIHNKDGLVVAQVAMEALVVAVEVVVLMQLQEPEAMALVAPVELEGPVEQEQLQP